MQTALSEPLSLRVEYLDGTLEDVLTTPVDIWKTERFFGQTLAAMNGSYSAIAYMAFSVCQRRGSAYKTKRQGTDPTSIFEAWLATIENVYVVTEEDTDAHSTNGSSNGGDPIPKESASLTHDGSLPFP